MPLVTLGDQHPVKWSRMERWKRRQPQHSGSHTGNERIRPFLASRASRLMIGSGVGSCRSGLDQQLPKRTGLSAMSLAGS